MDGELEASDLEYISKKWGLVHRNGSGGMLMVHSKPLDFEVQLPNRTRTEQIKRDDKYQAAAYFIPYLTFFSAPWLSWFRNNSAAPSGQHLCKADRQLEDAHVYLSFQEH